ncbi:gliding motility lipoprotein GldB [Siccationidurans ginsengisoli]|uniref:gliding motility lipoprotein GldB n=1 Tax=Hymenobacter TaxID=89966 RepID=UPI001AAD2C8F|nr:MULTISPECIES: gliding motility lipoprotein GldB [unclassified Hymenobacter]MBO2030402.1 gliding motility lipoprotein GldB [Hymenobacter sp. BT559]
MKLSSLTSIVLLAVVGLLAGCRQGADGCRPDPAANAPAASLQLKHLERAFFQIKNPAEGLQFMRANPVFARYYLQAGQAPPDTLAKALAQLATNPDLQQLSQQTATAFADSASLRQELASMFGRVKYYFPDFKAPAVAATYVSGLMGKDVYVNDSLLVISLDWFAGPKAKYRPDLPHYMLRRYRPAFVLPTLALAVSSKYNRHQLTATSMLDQMVDQGKRLYFAGAVLPCTSDSLLIGYSAKDLANVKFNEARIWGHFLENNLLFSTTPFVIQKYVGERPNVPEIDRTCPGRVGQWVGLQIVRKYMTEHSGVTLAQLMAEKDAQRILNESHYRPKKQ